MNVPTFTNPITNGSGSTSLASSQASQVPASQRRPGKKAQRKLAKRARKAAKAEAKAAKAQLRRVFGGAGVIPVTCSRL
jgi:hypothetical protein